MWRMPFVNRTGLSQGMRCALVRFIEAAKGDIFKKDLDDDKYCIT